MNKKILSIAYSLIVMVACTPVVHDLTISSTDEHAVVSDSGDISISLPSEGSYAAVTLSASETWAATLGDPDADSWCVVWPANGIAGQIVLTITAAQNASYEDRNATITFTSGEFVKTLIVSQSSNGLLKVEYDADEVPASGGTITVSVTYNQAYTCTVNADWIKAGNTQTAAVDGHTYSVDTRTFSVEANTSYEDRSCSIDFVSSDGSLSQNIDIVQARAVDSNLSSGGTANCYIVPAAGDYSFNAAVKGCGPDAISGTPASADVLWESFGTSETPSTGDIVSDVKYADGAIYFHATGRNGNALIALKDSKGNVLWSWHIWSCSRYYVEESAQDYNGILTMMDRNLGATSATPGDGGSLGLLYQWGRKDPFLGEASSSLTWPVAATSRNHGDMDYATTHPTTFITFENKAGASDNNGDWYYTGTTATNDTRWLPSTKNKTVYDPCPYGWRVPDGGSDKMWQLLTGKNSWTNASDWDSANYGIDYGKAKYAFSKSSVWYPAAGYIKASTGKIESIGQSGEYWTSSPSTSGTGAYCLNFDYRGYTNTVYTASRANGCSVRCVKN